MFPVYIFINKKENEIMDQSADINCTVSISWDQYNPDEWGGKLSIGGYKIGRDILLVNVSAEEVVTYNSDYSEIEPGWYYYDGECYHWNLEGDTFSEFDEFFADCVNEQLEYVRGLVKK